jgi:flagellin
VVAQKVDTPGSTGTYRVQLFAADGRDITINNASNSTQQSAGGSWNTASIMQLQGAYDSNGTITVANATAAGATAAGGATLGGTAAQASAVGGRVLFTNDVAFTLQTTAASPTNGLLNVSAAGQVIGGAKDQNLQGVSITTALGANRALSVIDASLSRISSERARLGALQNRFQMTVENLQSTSENLSASRSRIRDTDFAKETAELTRTQILQQAGTAMVAQANQIPQGVLSLLR